METGKYKKTSHAGTTPFVSVVIPTYNYDVSPLINDLMKTGYKNYEIIVADDCSKKEYNLPSGVQYLRNKENRGAGYSRNEGARVARGDIILFLDSDVMLTNPDNAVFPPVDIIKAHAEAYESDDIVGVLGPVEWYERNQMGDIFINSPYASSFFWPDSYDTVPWGPTANFSVKKEIFLKVNGFDTEFPKKGGGEDTDIGVRISEFGKIKTMKAPVFHPSPANLKKGIIDRIFRWGKAEIRLINKFPSRTITEIPYSTIASIIVLIGSGLLAYYRNVHIVLSLILIYISYLAGGILFRILQQIYDKLKNSQQEHNEHEEVLKGNPLQIFCTILLFKVYDLGKTVKAISQGNIMKIYKSFLFFDKQKDIFIKEFKARFYKTFLSIGCAIGMGLILFL